MGREEYGASTPGQKHQDAVSTLLSHSMEIANPAEIQVSMSAICEESADDTRSYIPETASKYVTADRPETTAAFPASQEIVVETNPNLTTSPNPAPSAPHISVETQTR